MGKTIPITDENFTEEVLNSKIPVLLDFWADWCGPCRAVAPALDEIAETYEGRLKVGKLNVDLNPRTTNAFGIRGIPTMIIFKDGAPGGKITGAVPKAHIAEVVEEVLDSSGAQ